MFPWLQKMLNPGGAQNGGGQQIGGLYSSPAFQPGFELTQAGQGWGPNANNLQEQRMIDFQAQNQNAVGGGGFMKGLGGLEGLSSLASGLASLGQAYGAIKGVKMAKEQLAFTKQAYNTNLKNQTQTYNTTLEGKAKARAVTEGKSQESAQEFFEKNKL